MKVMKKFVAVVREEDADASYWLIESEGATLNECLGHAGQDAQVYEVKYIGKAKVRTGAEFKARR